MTPHERFLATMHFRPVDRAPLWEWGPWPSARRRWQREALGAGNDPPQFAECENKIQCGVDLWMRPRYEERVISEDDESVTKVRNHLRGRGNNLNLMAHQGKLMLKAGDMIGNTTGIGKVIRGDYSYLHK